jgi:hypothetical protein
MDGHLNGSESVIQLHSMYGSQTGRKGGLYSNFVSRTRGN